jgi:hypothetical protein
MINSDILALICLTAMGVISILVIFVLPQRKLPEEEGMKLLYEERCSVT